MLSEEVTSFSRGGHHLQFMPHPHPLGRKELVLLTLSVKSVPVSTAPAAVVVVDRPGLRGISFC